jgi:hypothetical protein
MGGAGGGRQAVKAGLLKTYQTVSTSLKFRILRSDVRSGMARTREVAMMI